MSETPHAMSETPHAMSETPRLKSAFPQTPRIKHRLKSSDATPMPRKTDANKEAKPPFIVQSSPERSSVVPVEVVDAASQRFYAAAVYVSLNAWRLFDSWGVSDDLDSTWLFLKWVFIDGVFIFTLRSLRIPWLEWTFPTCFTVFLLHTAANVFLMFHIPLPLGAWLGGIGKLAYDRELSVSERRVKPADIIHNSSLILGKQIIHILPEGSAILNPDRIPLCLSSNSPSVSLPIRVNQTNPILIDLLRFDFDTGFNETITITQKQLKQLKRQAEKQRPHTDRPAHSEIHFVARKTGVYILQRVLDESNLEVHIQGSGSLIVSCPKALLKTTRAHKCKGELSDLMLEVEGTPPLKIKYSRRVNHLIGNFLLQNVQLDHGRLQLLPDHASSELLTGLSAQQLLRAQSQKVEIPLNESLNDGGEWTYAIEEVHDAYGNCANYTTLSGESDQGALRSRPQWHHFIVHERPQLSLQGCDAQKSLEVAKGVLTELPIHFQLAGRSYWSDAPFGITFSFSEAETSNDNSVEPKVRHMELKSLDQRISINEPGWYTLDSVSSKFCTGEILEPSSCLLHNPPEPDLALRTENIFDKCANNSVGLLVDLDLVGSPPFLIRYTVERGYDVETCSRKIDGLRGQLEFHPSEAGSYKYRFLDIADSVYGPRSLKDRVPPLVQDVKPPASARMTQREKYTKICFGESVDLGVSFFGESPWILQYEVVHNGKKSQRVLESGNESGIISTGPLTHGGEYVFSLTSVTDRSNCKRPLKESSVIDVRPKNPHASFARVDKGFQQLALEGSKVGLPLRLSGEAPWTVTYRNLDEQPSSEFKSTLWDQNGALEVSQRGRYQLVSVRDATCVGDVDGTSSIFDVAWIPRPRIASVDGSPLDGMISFTKSEVCQGDGDILELEISGNPPYNVKYEQQRKVDHGSSSIRVQNLRNVHNKVTIEMDTSKAGDYIYKFQGLQDSLYDHESKTAYFIVTQQVNPLPSARFESPGHIYGFCKEESDGDESIPIILEGVPPYFLEVMIKHHSKLKPEMVKIPHIPSNRHNLLIPRRHLELGQHVVSISKVRDARRCQKSSGVNEPSVRVAVSDVPTIIPLESQTDYCVGERISFSLSGHSPFEIYYTFDNSKRKATSTSTTFKRIAEKPGEFTITDVSDGASGRCKAHKNITKIIHEMPSVKISKGRVSVVDIHEGGEAELNFEFWGTPPFEFTYTRSSNKKKGTKPEILDIKHDVSYEHKKTIRTSDEGTYEVVAIKDKFCSFAVQRSQGTLPKTVKPLSPMAA